MAGLDGLEEDKMSCPLPGYKPQTDHLVASLYTNIKGIFLMT